MAGKRKRRSTTVSSKPSNSSTPDEQGKTLGRKEHPLAFALDAIYRAFVLLDKRVIEALSQKNYPEAQKEWDKLYSLSLAIILIQEKMVMEDKTSAEIKKKKGKRLPEQVREMATREHPVLNNP
jgi:hypothetical protein